VVALEGFGDNSLNFVLRTFLPNLENRLEVIHDLHMTIDRLFREAGIEIAFPQRDLHIRTAPPAVAASLAAPTNERVDRAHRLPERSPLSAATEQPGARARSA
jgi:potassium efflux system protein